MNKINQTFCLKKINQENNYKKRYKNFSKKSLNKKTMYSIVLILKVFFQLKVGKKVK